MVYENQATAKYGVKPHSPVHNHSRADDVAVVVEFVAHSQPLKDNCPLTISPGSSGNSAAV